MNLWRSIRNASAYWFARLILGQGAEQSQAFSSGITFEERMAIRRWNARRRYWRFRAAGKTPLEAACAMNGQDPVIEREKRNRRSWRRRQRWGGSPIMGTEAFNRWAAAML